MVCLYHLKRLLLSTRTVLNFNKWTDGECAVFLHDSLTGNASQLLWELNQDASADEVIKLLTEADRRIKNLEECIERQNHERGLGLGLVETVETSFFTA